MRLGICLIGVAAGACSAPGSYSIAVAGLESPEPRVAVSASWVNSCALSGSGALQCWGGNYDGQLGNGGATDSHVPVGPRGMEGGVRQVSAGGSSACALTRDGAVLCWGLNTNGQLGTGSPTNREREPRPVRGLERGVRQVALGSDHGCAILVAGTLRCWGANEVGQLGTGGRAPSREPVDVPGFSALLVDVQSAGAHSCALDTEGGVLCWGNNERGQVGDGTTEDRTVPTRVALPARAVAISAGHEHSCAVVEDGHAFCWGRNDFGQLGDGTKGDASAPRVVRELDRATTIAAGGYHTCALSGDGRARCWGLGLSGQLGSGESVPAATSPIDVRGLREPPSSLALGLYHSCAVLAGGDVACWGLNGYAGALAIAPDVAFEALAPRVVVFP